MEKNALLLPAHLLRSHFRLFFFVYAFDRNPAPPYVYLILWTLGTWTPPSSSDSSSTQSTYPPSSLGLLLLLLPGARNRISSTILRRHSELEESWNYLRNSKHLVLSGRVQQQSATHPSQQSFPQGMYGENRRPFDIPQGNLLLFCSVTRRFLIHPPVFGSVSTRILSEFVV